MTARVSFGERLRRVGLALVWIALFTAVGSVASFVLVRLMPVAEASRWSLARNGAGLALGFGFATWLVGVRFARLSWDDLGWHTGGAEGLVGRIARGVVLGVVMAATAIGLAFVGSRAVVRVAPEWPRYLAHIGPVVAALVGAALFEELLFRGFPLRRLANALGPWAATAVLAAGFALVHLWNPNAGLFGTINIALAAVWLSAAFFSPGGMGLAWGLHFGWNAGLAVLFDAPVSGQRFVLPAVEYQPGRHPWVDGGTFGPEGGLVATLVFVAGTLAVIGARWRQPQRWLLG